METSTKLKIIAVVAVIAAPFLTLEGQKEKQRLAALEKDGITVNGILEGGESRKSGKRSRSYSFDASFTPQGGTPITKSFKVKSTFFDSHTDDTSITIPEVQVRYLAASPQESAIIVGGSTDNALLFEAGIGVGAGGLILLIVMFLIKKPAEASLAAS